MTATKLQPIRPVPEAPPTTPWEYLEAYVDRLLDAREWEGEVTFDDFGRLNMLAADLRTDIMYLDGLAGKLDGVIGMLLGEVRNVTAADDAR